MEKERVKSLKELVAEKQIFAPIVWNALSARAAEAAGCEATLLSGGVLHGMRGYPDACMLAPEDLYFAVSGICRVSGIPCCIDSDEGYGDTALNAYRLTKTLIDIGAKAQTLDDTAGRPPVTVLANLRAGREDCHRPCISREAFLAKTRAAMDAASGSDFLNIARSEAKLQYGLDEAIERCRRAVEIGAEMTLVIGLMTLDDAKRVAKYVPGWKMWPDVCSTNGVPDVELDDIYKLGFNFVTAHMVTKGATYGMTEAGRRFAKAGTPAPLDAFDMGYPKEEIDDLMNFVHHGEEDWLARERKYWEGL